MQVKDKIRLLREQLKKTNELELIEAVERKQKKQKVTQNEIKRQKYAYKRGQLAKESSKEVADYLQNEVLPSILPTSNFSDFSDLIVLDDSIDFTKKVNWKEKDKERLEIKKKIKALKKDAIRNKKIVSEAQRFITYLRPLVNVYLDENWVREQEEEIVKDLSDMKNMSPLHLKGFQKTMQKWWVERSKIQIVKPNPKAEYYKLKYAYDISTDGEQNYDENDED